MINQKYVISKNEPYHHVPFQSTTPKEFDRLVFQVKNSLQWAKFYRHRHLAASNIRQVRICLTFKAIRDLIVAAQRLADVVCQRIGEPDLRLETMEQARVFVLDVSRDFLADVTLQDFIGNADSAIDRAWLFAPINPCKGTISPQGAWERFKAEMILARECELPTGCILFIASANTRRPWIVAIFNGVTHQVEYFTEFFDLNSAISRFNILRSWSPCEPESNNDVYC